MLSNIFFSCSKCHFQKNTSATETTFLLPAKNKRSRTSFWTVIYRVENFGKKLFITCTQRKWKGTDTSVPINHFLPKLYFYTQIEFTWLDETEILTLAWPAKAKRLRDPSRISLEGLRIRIGRWRYHIFDTSDTEVRSQNIVTSVLYRCSFVWSYACD